MDRERRRLPGARGPALGAGRLRRRPGGKKGYEIPLTRLFHKPVEPRPSDEIKDEIRELRADFRGAIEAVLA